MSRSYKKSPVSGHTYSTSEKDDKQIYNRRYRRHVRSFVNKGWWDKVKHLKELSNVRSMSKDGKCWYTEDDLKRISGRRRSKIFRK